MTGLKVFEMSFINDNLCKSLIPEESADLNTLESSDVNTLECRKNIMTLAVSKILRKFMDLSLIDEDIQPVKHPVQGADDKVHAYACSILTHGLFYMEFQDVIREGDGQRILGYWRYCLMLFKETGRINFSVEVFNLLAQYHFLLSLRVAMQLLWNCTVNVHGHAGRKVRCDLCMEHLNREAKMALLVKALPLFPYFLVKCLTIPTSPSFIY